MPQDDSSPGFAQLGLSAAVLRALDDAGYETPTPIQIESIPPLLAGEDLLGQAQTGTGKTAAFALPLLSRLDPTRRELQLLVLAPTRELAIQVAEAFQTYARHIPGFHVLPVYGGQDYGIQLRQLSRGAQVVVGTPGRVMDHMRRGTLKLDKLSALVLDEADEMLRMGFIDDVEWILEQTPSTRQIALFSATMPPVIRKVADQHLRNPRVARIQSSTTTAATIRQRYWQVSGLHKLDALTRLLETEAFDAMLVFVRTKTATVELAEKLAARGYACDALNGDIPQHLRERTVDRLKKGSLDILVATDVVARGLDVERISHVVNYDVPTDPESYVHRIGRTGRAGRAGEAILFVAPRERRLLYAIERATRQPIESMTMPTVAAVNVQRMQRFKQRIADTLAGDAAELATFEHLVEEFQQENDVEPQRLAAALARMAQGDEPLLMEDKPLPRRRPERASATPERKPGRGGERGGPRRGESDVDMERFRIEVGHQHKVKPGNIVGAIANEAGLDSRYIGRVEIYDDHSTVDLPSGMPKAVRHALQKARVVGRKLDLKPMGPMASKGGPGHGKSDKPERYRKAP